MTFLRDSLDMHGRAVRIIAPNGFGNPGVLVVGAVAHQTEPKLELGSAPQTRWRRMPSNEANPGTRLLSDVNRRTERNHGSRHPDSR